MPAINALLPIVAASNSQNESTQNRADENRANVAKNAASTVNKGLEQDAAAEKRMQQKRFINAYEEGIQEQGKQEERRALRAAARELDQRDETAALAAGGSTLPPVGEPLPTMAVVDTPAANAESDTRETTTALDAEFSAAPLVPTAQTSTPPETLSFEQRQQAVAEDFHAVVNAHNDKANGQGGQQEATLSAAQPPSASAVALQAQDTEFYQRSAIAKDDGSTLAPVTALDSVPDAGDALTQADTLSPAPQTDRSAAPVVLALQGHDGILVGDEPEQAQLVRAWRGIDGQELRSATAPSVHASRQDPIAPAVPLSLSGQIQQFAQSLRLHGGQPDAALGATTAERGTTSAPHSSAELSPWRADTASLNTASAAGRATALNTPFAQAMQASNFGQALGSAVGQNAWGESIAQRVSLMAGLKVSSAQIQLDPPELGAMTVKVSVTGDQASVSFHSPHAVVRDALELSFPRLQEMMGQQGMQLIDAQVSDNSFAGQGSGESSSDSASQSRGDAQDDGASATTPQIVRIATGLIDFYA